jgi:hypothetical protein
MSGVAAAAAWEGRIMFISSSGNGSKKLQDWGCVPAAEAARRFMWE